MSGSPCREAAVEIQSNVPWIGFPVGYAVSGVLLTVFGYFAMVLPNNDEISTAISKGEAQMRGYTN